MIPQVGFCIHLNRIRQERRVSIPHGRTVGEYQCYWNGEKILELEGQMVECAGPGDNTTEIGNENDLRIAAGTYPIAVHSGSKYKTIGYSKSEIPASLPRPGILLKDTRERTYILIHPASNYLWSVGCLNPASGLVDANSAIDYKDSRKRVIALIDFIKNKSTYGEELKLPKCVIIIEGEPL